MQSTKDSFLEIVNALGSSKELYLNEINEIINELNIVQSLRDTLVRSEGKKSEKEEILDEPFKGLDIELKKKMIALILEEKRQFLIITHEAEDAVLLGANVINIQ